MGMNKALQPLTGNCNMSPRTKVGLQVRSIQLDLENGNSSGG